MGFAGQVFAARVAIGLAFPSKQAMGEASQIIGAGAAQLYKKVNSSALKAAKTRQTNLESELKILEKTTDKHRASLEMKLAGARKRFQSSMGRMNLGAKVTAGQTQKAFIGAQKKMGTAKTDTQLANTFKAGQKAFLDFARHVKSRAPDLAIEVFGKGEFDKDFAEQPGHFMNMADQMMQSGKHAKRMREELTLVARLELENAKRRQQNGMEEIRMMRMKLKVAFAMKQINKDQMDAGMEALQTEEDAFRDNVKAAEGHYSFLKEAVREYDTTQTRWANKLKKQEQEELKIKAKIRKSITKVTLEVKRLAKGMKNAAKKAGMFAESLKTNFQNSLRESVSALTAMFYKLQQNTQELVEFERELMNANSVFNLTRKELYKTSQVITQFGQNFGMEMQNGAEGLYQLASAGLTADQSMLVLPETLKLSMAVQGDHNTIAKLTTQTLMGFSMEMTQAAEVTDKFAHVIQKSLIEYEDLSSAVKFAMPFFTATGQSVDQLLGALEVLTNRALEAGIAGRGLRQALAEFAEHADDNTAAFARMGLEIKKADGSMKDLTVIAKEYSDIIGPEAAANTELLTSLIDDLNVRGATAFVHLVQNADEFGQAVEDVENAGGELDEMVRIQNESMQAQIQILKNNVQMMFFYSDEVERANGAMNEFHSAILDGISSFQDLIVEGEEGNKQLTEFGHTIQDVAVEAVQLLITLLQDGVKFLAEFSGQGKTAIGILKAYMLPLKILMKIIDIMGPKLTSMVIQFSMLNKIFSLTAGLRATVAGFSSLYTWLFKATIATEAETLAVEGAIAAKTTEIGVNNALVASEVELAAARGGATSAAAGEAAVEGGAAGAGAGKVGTGAAGAGAAGGGALKMGKAGKPPGPLTKSGKPDMRFAANKKWAKNAGKPAKIGRLTRLWTMLGSAVSGTAAIMAAAAVAVMAVGAAGLSLMDSLGPTIDIIKGWGASIRDLFSWLGLKIIQVAGTFGFLPEKMGDAATMTKNALDEIKWAFIYWGMKISFILGSSVGYIVWAIDQMFIEIGKLIDDAIGDSWLTDAILGGFEGIWNGLFDPEEGWLRWLTLTWWTTAFGDLKAWLTDYDWGALMPEWIPTFTLPEFLTYDYWFGDEGVWSDLVAGFEMFKLDPIGTMVTLAKFSMNAFLQIYNSFATRINGINFDFHTGGWEAKTMPMYSIKDLAWYDQEIIGAWEGVGFEVDMTGTMELQELLEYRTGGYVRGMQQGGPLNNNQPYLVGEAGPELFKPNQSGQIINTSRTHNIMRNQLDGGLGRPTQDGGSKVMMVDRMEVRESRMNKTKIAVDTFAGVA